jgi:UDP-N-acetyl-D-mannosaminuronic acid transferase (WecB/TagA/CpsF family)
MSTAAKAALNREPQPCRQILGLRFFTGNPAEAVDLMIAGGLLVVPAAPALKDLPFNASYREALLNADLTITDSGFMVLLWNLIQRDHVRRLSGLSYLRHLLIREEVRRAGASFWIMPNEASARRNARWLRSQRVRISPENIYVAPMYGKSISDPELLTHLNRNRPAHIVITIGGGNQERLGLYLKRNLDFQPAIHCVGAALAFLSGDQVRIPEWADRAYIGWFLRCLSHPRQYVGRYWGARKLLPLILRYRDKLPALEPGGLS